MVYDIVPEESPAKPPGIVTIKPGPLEEDLGCVSCGYNLRGLPRHHRCPECGTAVQASISGQRLMSAPVVWLEKVATGLLMLLGSTAAAIVSDASMLWFTVVGYLLRIAGAGLAFAGVIYLTSPEPRQSLMATGYSLRQGLRHAAIAQLASSLLLLASTWNLPSVLIGLAAVIHDLASISLLIGMAIYLRRLAVRMDDNELEQRTAYVLWGFGGSVAVSLLFGLLSLVLSGRSVGPAACIVLAAIFSAIFFAAWFCLLLYRYYQAIRWAIYEARVQKDARDA